MKNEKIDKLMLKPSEWLDLIKEWKGLETDKEVAAFLDVKTPTYTNWKKDRFPIQLKAAMRIGTNIGVNPLFIMASSNFHTTKDKENQKYWRVLARTIEPKIPNQRGNKPIDPL